MNTRSETQRRLTLYVIPVLIGLGGVVYSQQLDHFFWRAIALLISVALPLYAGGNLLARYHTSAIERFIMLSGVLMLILGAAFSVSGLTDRLAEVAYVQESVINASRVIGMVSLFLGLFVVLFTVVRTGEGIDEMAERFRFLAEHISEGFILSTPDGAIILVNQKVLDMFGVSRESVLGRNARELASAFGLESIVGELDNRAAGVASEYEIVFSRNGEERTFMINGAPVFNQQGRHTLTMATVRDITEHKQLTQRVEQYARGLRQLVEQQTRKLHQSEERMRQLLLSMNEGFLTIDLEHKIRFANEQACLLLKTHRETLFGREIFSYVDGVGRSRLLNLFARAMAEQPGKGLRQEIEFLDADGGNLPTVAGVAYLNAPDEDARGYSIVITPVADLKRMQQQLIFRARELERANEELRLHDRAKDSFLSNVSHELRTPLTTIQGYLEMFVENSLGPLTESQRHALTVMERNAQHLLTHINEMIEFSRMQIRGIQIVSNLYDACALAREAAAAILPSAVEKGVSVRTLIPDAPVYAWGDRDKLSQVLGILLNNAVKFTDRGGSATLSLTVKEGTTVEFVVKDTGIGIAKDYQEKIFTRFFQVDSSKTRQYEGAGIGLSIARNILHAHGGGISVESVYGAGAAFICELPDSIFVNQMDPELAASLDDQHVLLVDESEERQAALRSFPPLNRCPVICAANGFYVTRAVNVDAVDIIVINDAPADVAGETTLRVIRQQPELVGIPIIVLTNEGGEVIRRAIDRESEVHFIFKPFTAEMLVNRIRHLRMGGETLMEEAAIEELYQSRQHKPSVLVVDADPAFLEWVETALSYHNIECCCANSSVKALDLLQSFSPEVIFWDEDLSREELLERKTKVKIETGKSNVPIYAMSGLPTREGVEFSDNTLAGRLQKPFPISDMMDIIAQTGNR